MTIMTKRNEDNLNWVIRNWDRNIHNYSQTLRGRVAIRKEQKVITKNQSREQATLQSSNLSSEGHQGC